MTPALPSHSFKSAPVFELSPTVRAVIDAMPIVIFAKAIGEALRSRKKAAATARTSTAR